MMLRASFRNSPTKDLHEKWVGGSTVRCINRPMPVNLKFPVICFERNIMFLRNSWKDLTETTTAGLKNGLYKNRLIIDSKGMGVETKGASKLYGIGLFRGWNMFLNQRIRVDLQFRGKPFSVNVDEVRLKIFNLIKRCNWKPVKDFKGLEKKISNAKSMGEIIQLLKNAE